MTLLKPLDTLTEEDVLELLRAGVQEGRRAEYKTDVPHDLGRHVAGMASAHGGLIALGVTEDQTRPVDLAGLPRGNGDLKVRLVQKIIGSVIPTPPFDVGVTPLQADPEKLAAVIEVHAGDYPPYVYRENQFVIRRDGLTGPATLDEVEQMFMRRGRRRQRVDELFANLHEQSAEPLGELPTEDSRRLVRLQLSAAPLLRVHSDLDSRGEQELLAITRETFGWSDANAAVSDRDAESVVFSALSPDVGTRRWKLHADGHCWFVTPIVYGSIRDGAREVYLVDVTADLLRALAWVGRCQRWFGVHGDVALRGDFWTHGFLVRNASRVRIHNPHGDVALAGVQLGEPQSRPSRAFQRCMELRCVEGRRGRAELAADLLRTALRSQWTADIQTDVLVQACEQLDRP